MDATCTEEAACPIRVSAPGTATVDPQSAMATLATARPSTPRAAAADSAATRSGSSSPAAAAAATATAGVAVAWVKEPM